MIGGGPCKDCKDRCYLCHASCTSYKAWKLEAAQVSKARQEYYAKRKINPIVEANERKLLLKKLKGYY